MLSDINAGNEHGETPLHHAASRRDVSRARALIADGADVDAENEGGETPLHYAASEGDTNMARMLVKAGADVNARDKRGRTPLHHVAWEGYTHTARALIALGADVNPTDIYGHTPMHYAQLENDGEMVRTLIEAEMARKAIVKAPSRKPIVKDIDGEPKPEWTDHIDNRRYENPQESESGCGLAIAAIAVALIGAYFLIDNFGIWGFVWRSALIIPGLWLALDSSDSDGRLWFGIALIGGGVFFSLITLDTTPGWIVGLIWAVALIAASSWIISRARRR